MPSQTRKRGLSAQMKKAVRGNRFDAVARLLGQGASAHEGLQYVRKWPMSSLPPETTPMGVLLDTAAHTGEILSPLHAILRAEKSLMDYCLLKLTFNTAANDQTLLKQSDIVFRQLKRMEREATPQYGQRALTATR